MGLVKRLGWGFVAVALMMAMMPGLGVRPLAAEEFGANQTVSLNTDALNLRTELSLSGDAITVLGFETTGTVTEEPVFGAGSTWYRVTSDQYGTGWAAGEFLAEL